MKCNWNFKTFLKIYIYILYIYIFKSCRSKIINALTRDSVFMTILPAVNQSYHTCWTFREIVFEGPTQKQRDTHVHIDTNTYVNTFRCPHTVECTKSWLAVRLSYFSWLKNDMTLPLACVLCVRDIWTDNQTDRSVYRRIGQACDEKDRQ